MLYRFQPARLMPPVLLLAAMCAVSYRLYPESWHHLTRNTQVIFAVCFLTFAILMIILRNRCWLRIDERGIEVKFATGTPRFYDWQDVVSARISRKTVMLIPFFSSIQLQLRPASQPANVLRQAASAVGGFDATFPSYFEISPTEILERIHFYKSQNQPL
jgi:hypothetical protein